jgi:hypothetical protein
MLPQAGSASLSVDLLNCEAFIQRSSGAQHLYFLMFTQPGLDRAGGMPLLPLRWVTYAADLTVPGILADITELEASGLLEVDHSTQEVWIRDWLRNGRLGLSPTHLGAARKAIDRWMSERLRGVALAALAERTVELSDRAPRGRRARILARDGARCNACAWSPGDPIPPRVNGQPYLKFGLEIDHVYPRGRGGSNTDENLQVLCTKCNLRKRDRIYVPTRGRR